MGNEVTTQNEGTMSAFLSKDNIKEYLQKILGERTPQFITSLSTIVGSDEKLNACTRNSLMSCALKAASMNLPLDPSLGFAYAIPFKDNKKGVSIAQFLLGAKAFTQLAYRSGQVSRLNAMEVVEGEFKGRDFIGEPVIEFLPEDERKGREVIGYMAGMQLTNGFTKVVYWTVKDLLKHATNYSQTYKADLKYGSKSSLWNTNFDAMARKTVLKNLLSKYAPLDTTLQQAIKYDQATIQYNEETGEEEITYPDNMEELKTTITKDQIREIATLVGFDEKKLEVLKKLGYEPNTLNTIPAEDYEYIVSTLKE